jgi:hypothetical protein
MSCLSTPAEIVTGGDIKEQLRLDDEIMIDLGNVSMSFDDDVEVLEEYTANTPTSQPSLNPVSCDCEPSSTELPASVSPTSQPSRPIQRRDSLTKRLGINFQWASARKIDPNNNPVRQRVVPSVRHEVDHNGYCTHHPDIQLYRRRSDDSSDWAVVRKKCPSCISKDCPIMMGDNVDSKSKDTTLQLAASEITDDDDDKDGEKNEILNLTGDKVVIESNMKRRNSFVQSILNDFSPNGDQKILRAVGRTATVNAAVLLTAATGGVGASAVGYAAGGAITAKRLSDGVKNKDEKEVTKSVAVFGCATGASIAGQAITGALMIGVAGASLPVAAAVAFGVGVASGVTAGALSEWTVDGIMDKIKLQRGKEALSNREDSDDSTANETRDEAASRRDSCT